MFTDITLDEMDTDLQIARDYARVRKYLILVNQLPYLPDNELEQRNWNILLESGFRDGTDLFKNYYKQITPKSKGEAMRVALNNAIRNGDFFAIKDIEEFKTGLWIVDQPLGKSSYPDKLIIMYGRVVMVEDKSSTKSAYRFNNTCPHPKTLYIFSDGRHNQTRAMFAQEFINLNQYQAVVEALRRGIEAFNHEVGIAMDEAGIADFFLRPYARPQFNTIGGYQFTDFVRLHDENDWAPSTKNTLLYQFEKGVRDYTNHKYS